MLQVFCCQKIIDDFKMYLTLIMYIFINLINYSQEKDFKLIFAKDEVN